MPRTTLIARLEALEHQIGLSAASIATHLAMIERERADTIRTGTSEATLAILRVTLAAQEAERARLRAELAALSSPAGSGDA